jgi:hypothetical protein
MSIIGWIGIALSLGSLCCAAYAYWLARKALDDAERHVKTAQALVRRIQAFKNEGA